MKFWYKIVTFGFVDIDFQEIYNYIKSDNPDIKTYDVYNTFIDNVTFYLRSIYGCEDLEEDDNEHNINELIDSWGDWLEETFGENWDEI